MKILMISDLFFPVDGGVPVVVGELSKRLVQRGHQVMVATYKFDKSWKDEEIIDGIEIFRTPLKWKRFVPFYLSGVVNMRNLARRIMEKENFDLVNIHLSLSGWGALGVDKVKRLPLVFTFQGNWAKEYLAEAKGLKKGLGICLIEGKLMKYLQKECLKRVGLIAVASNYTQGEVKGLLPEIADKKIKVVPLGVDLNKFKVQSSKFKTDFRGKIDVPKEKFLILTIRRLFKRMGLENLVEAIDIVRKEYPEVFLIIGGRGHLRESLKFKIQNSKLEEFVRLEGFIPEEEKANYLAATDLYVLPTVLLEGFGLTTLEALACGTPVLGTPTGATPEVLGSFDPNFVLQGTAPEDIARGIVSFIKNYGKDEKIRQKCREYAEGFSWEKVVDEYESLYGSLINID